MGTWKNKFPYHSNPKPNNLYIPCIYIYIFVITVAEFKFLNSNPANVSLGKLSQRLARSSRGLQRVQGLGVPPHRSLLVLSRE